MPIKDVTHMSKKELLALPKLIGPWNKAHKCTSFVVLPSNKVHDSGFKVMYFIPCSHNTPLGIIEGSCDVIHIQGISGKGKTPPDIAFSTGVKPVGWSVDCLPASGLLRFFAEGNVEIGPQLSSVEVFG